MSLALYISEALDCSRSRVFSIDNPVPIPMSELVVNDLIDTQLFLVDGQGGYSALSGADGVTVKVGIGDLTTAEPVWLSQVWNQNINSNGWTGTVSLQSSGLVTILSGRNVATLSFRVKIIDTNNHEQTFALLPFKFWGIGIASSTTPDVPVDSTDGEFAIVNGADTVTVTGLNLSAVPRRVFPVVRKPVGGENLFPTVVQDSITTDGFTVDLGGETDSDQYKLEYLLIF
jgi:hypothetical protein